MKILLMTSCALAFVCAAGFAKDDGGEKKEERFQEHKQEMLKNLDTRIEALHKTKACVEAAKDKEGLKSCMEQEKAQMKAFHETKKKEQLQKIEEQQKRLEEKKQELLNKDEEGKEKQSKP